MATKKTAGKKAVAKKSARRGPKSPAEVNKIRREIRGHLTDLELQLATLNKKIELIGHDFGDLGGSPPKK